MVLTSIPSIISSKLTFINQPPSPPFFNLSFPQVDKLRGFFIAFFMLPQDMWGGFLAGWPGLPGNTYHESWYSRLSFALQMFTKMTNDTRFAMIIFSVQYTLKYVLMLIMLVMLIMLIMLVMLIELCCGLYPSMSWSSYSILSGALGSQSRSSSIILCNIQYHQHCTTPAY